MSYNHSSLLGCSDLLFFTTNQGNGIFIISVQTDDIWKPVKLQRMQEITGLYSVENVHIQNIPDCFQVNATTLYHDIYNLKCHQILNCERRIKNFLRKKNKYGYPLSANFQELIFKNFI